MNVESFLIEHLVDSFYLYSEVVEGKSAEEVDKMFYTVEGGRIN